jgi:hypothetical protein
LWTICLGWPWTVILLISVSQVARIIGVSHWCPAQVIFMFQFYRWTHWAMDHILIECLDWDLNPNELQNTAFNHHALLCCLQERGWINNIIILKTS